MEKKIFKRENIEYELNNGIWKGSKNDTKDFRYGKILFQTMRKNKNSVGQVDGVTGEEDTFGEMLDRSIRCAVWMKKQNIKPGDVIAVCTFNHFNAMIPILSSLFIGSIFNTWWQILEKDIIKHYINLCSPKVLFTYEEHAKLVKEVAAENNFDLKIVVFENNSNFESFEKILKDQNPKEVNNFECTEIVDPNHPAMILYTSGTTGNPKGCLHTYKSVANSSGFVVPEILRNSVGMNFSTTAWISGVMNPLKAIEYGAKLIIWSDISETESFELIEKYKVKFIFCGAGVANRLAKNETAETLDFSSVKYFSFGGAIARKEIGDILRTLLPNAEVFQVYGATETNACVTCAKSIHRTDTCGVPAAHMEIKLVNHDGKIIMNANEEGEIHVKSPFIMITYYKNEKAYKEVVDSDGWYHTGDAAYFNENGEFFIIDRMREFIKLRYTHIPPRPIEDVISEHPGVFEVAVVAKPDNDDVEQPIAFVVKNNSSQVTKEEIINLVDEKLPERFQLVGGVEFIDELPRTSSGKVAKRTLRETAKRIAISQHK